MKKNASILAIVATLIFGMMMGCNKDSATKEGKNKDSAAKREKNKKPFIDLGGGGLPSKRHEDPFIDFGGGRPPSENPVDFFPMQTGAT